MKEIKIFVTLLALTSLAACSGSKDADIDDDSTRPVLLYKGETVEQNQAEDKLSHAIKEEEEAADVVAEPELKKVDSEDKLFEEAPLLKSDMQEKAAKQSEAAEKTVEEVSEQSTNEELSTDLKSEDETSDDTGDTEVLEKKDVAIECEVGKEFNGVECVAVAVEADEVVEAVVAEEDVAEAANTPKDDLDIAAEKLLEGDKEAQEKSDEEVDKLLVVEEVVDERNDIVEVIVEKEVEVKSDNQPLDEDDADAYLEKLMDIDN